MLLFPPIEKLGSIPVSRRTNLGVAVKPIGDSDVVVAAVGDSGVAVEPVGPSGVVVVVVGDSSVLVDHVVGSKFHQ